MPGVVSRPQESRVVSDFLRSAAHQPSGLVIEGEPGIGKTTLWLSGVEEARDSGYRVFQARVGQAESVLAERLAHVGDAGAQRLERRLSEATTVLEQQREARLEALDARIVEFEGELRRRLEELAADADAERAVLEARVQELVRRLDAAGAVQRAR